MKQFYYSLIIFVYSLFISAQTTGPTGNSAETGITEGKLSVSLSGAATYNIPIAVPPGINGVVPQISLAYNSQGSNGMAGYGWNIAGVSSITRVPSTKFHNNNVGTIKYNLSDNYALDGQRLVVKDGTNGVYGENGTEYETENFSNIKITSYGVSSPVANYGPSYFIVEYPDGSKAYYGYVNDNNSNSRSQNEYAITYWENPQGVRINYNYTFIVDKKLIINSIKYGATYSNTTINEITFIYKNRLVPEIQYISGLSNRDDKILSEIKVVGNGIGFKNYILAHDNASLGYERLINITEKSGDNSKILNPTVFTYVDNQSPINPSVEWSNTSTHFVTTNSNVNQVITGDYNGDGEIEFLSNKGTGISIYKVLDDYSVLSIANQNSTIFKNDLPRFTINSLDGNFKISNKQNLCTIENLGNYNKNVKIYSCNINNNSIDLEYEKNFTELTTSYDTSNPTYNDSQKDWYTFSNDFNGDHLTDLVYVNIAGGLATTQFVNLDRRITTDFATDSGTINIGTSTFALTPNVSNGLATITGTSIIKEGDINGDGKTDLIIFRGSPYNDIQTYSLVNNNFEQIINWSYNLPGYIGSDFFQRESAYSSIVGTGKQRFPIVIGDYNGDGKSDILFVALGKILISTGKNYIEETLPSTFKAPVYPYSEQFLAIDYNNDGKSDVVRINPILNTYLTSTSYFICYDSSGVPYQCYPQPYYNYDHGIKIGFYSRSGVSANPWLNYNFEKLLATYKNDTNTQDNNGFDKTMIPLFVKKSKVNPAKSELAILGNSTIDPIAYSKISFFSSNSYLSNQNLLKDVTSGNGVKETITYKPLINGNSTYMSDYSEIYPSLNINASVGFQVVSQLEKQSATVYKKQLFSYYGAVTNTEGLGFLGFRSIAKTNWFDANNPIITTVSKFDPNLRGANIESYTVIGQYNASDYAAPSNFISKSITPYSSSLGANKVFSLKNTTAEQYNGLDNTNSKTTTIYDVYNNPKLITTQVKAGGSVLQTTETILDYDDQPNGTTYYIGRPTSKTQSVTVAGDVTNSEELYTYTNHLLTKIKKRGNGTDYVIEDNLYDAFGNITKKTITAPAIAPNSAPDPRVTNYEYNPAFPYNGRFLTKSKDIHQLVTQYDYNPSSGVLNSVTNPYNLVTSYLYDPWFKKTQTTDYLGKKIIFSYTNMMGIFGIDTQIREIGDDGSVQEIYYDDLGREVLIGKKNVSSSFFYSKTVYDIYDRKIKIYEPFSDFYSYNNPNTLFSTTLFDDYGRIKESKSFTGKIVTMQYDGLKTIVLDGSKTKTYVKNAIGNVVSLKDETATTTGTINYTYFANGNLRTTDYGEIITEIEQDEWGRKKTLKDPTAGTYRYTYNGFGETTNETTPNGTTTYNLDSFGRLDTKIISGTKTNSKTTYNYDSTSKLLNSSIFEDLQAGTTTNYIYSYDSYKRLYKTEEVTPSHASFTKQFWFDSFGRVEKETSIAGINGKLSNRTIKNTYKNGHPWQILDDTTQQVLWQTNSVNARGQLTGATMANGNISVSNTYDSYGFITKMKQDRLIVSSDNIMTMNTVFDSQKGNLTSRANSLFDYNETFDYDSQDRLSTIDTDEVLEHNRFNTTNNREGHEPLLATTLTFARVTIYGYLHIRATNKGHGVKKTLLSGDNQGDVVTISFNLDKIAGTDNFNIYVQEKDPNSGSEIKYFKQNANNGINSFSHTVNKNCILSYSIEKENTTTEVNQCHLDNVRISTIPKKITQAYDDYGRIVQNDLGTYNYSNNDKKYQNTSITLSPETLAYYQTYPTQNISYNVFKSPYQIEEVEKDKISFTYNDNNSRSTMFYGGLQTDKLQRRYRKYYSADGSMEIKVDTQNNNTTEFITYIGGDGYTAPIVLKSDGTTQNYLYLQRDYQGSIVAISDATGQVLEKRLFDAWGSLINYYNASGIPFGSWGAFDRGYTGHEHLQSVGLIHMNGRLYDPKLHRFLQPDNNIQDPFNTQNYNRYSYVLNNPLKYTDPSGEFWQFIAGALFSGYASGVQSSGGQLNPAKWNSTAWTNAALGGVSFGASTIATNYTNNYLDNYNKPPELGVSAISDGNIKDHSYVSIAGGDIHMPTQHSSLGFNWTFLSEGKPFSRFIYVTANTISVFGQYFMGRGVGDGSMRNLDGTATTTDEAVMAYVNIMSLSTFGVGNAVESTAAEIAAGWQGRGAYSGVDQWRNITLSEGKYVVGGLPGQSNFYTTVSGLNRSALNQETLFEGLQVAKHPLYGYRSHVGIYEVTRKTSASFGTTYANPQFGAGGIPQIFIPDYSGLQLIKIIPLK